VDLSVSWSSWILLFESNNYAATTNNPKEFQMFQCTTAMNLNQKGESYILGATFIFEMLLQLAILDSDTLQHSLNEGVK